MIEFIGTSLQFQSIVTAHTLNSFWTTSVRWMPYEESLTNIWLLWIYWVHESTAFYNRHAALIEITASTGSITVLHESVVSETVC
jgi:hypothetical protein